MKTLDQLDQRSQNERDEDAYNEWHRNVENYIPEPWDAYCLGLERGRASNRELSEALQRASVQFDFTVAALAKGQTVSISSLQNCAAACNVAIAKAKLGIA